MTEKEYFKELSDMRGSRKNEIIRAVNTRCTVSAMYISGQELEE